MTSCEQELSMELLCQFYDGDDEVASRIFQRYTRRLIALVRSRVDARFCRRFDPEDIVQATFSQFFSQTKTSRVVLKQRGDLWRLLAAITVKKIQNEVSWHTAEKRTVSKDESGSVLLSRVDQRIPDAADLCALQEEVSQVRNRLNPMQCKMFDQLMAGNQLDAIAENTQRSERSVFRALSIARHILEGRLKEYTINND